MTLINGYTTAEGNTPQFRLIYQLDGSTIVKFRGQVKKTSGQFIANQAGQFAVIHQSMIPASNEFIQIASSASSGARCVVETSGNVQAMCASNADYIILSAITFILG